ncbi:MAG: helix-turn-helix transcriptional regulator [Thermaerobacter sp.]|nr:helix-turn-helix transcriptional regulator [Thermaerobacter sp.]
MERWVNPLILRWARQRLRLSPEEAVRLVRGAADQGYAAVSAPEVERWERGETEPGIDALDTLAAVYECPVGYFFLDVPPEEDLPLDFRGLAEDKRQAFSQPPTAKAVGMRDQGPECPADQTQRGRHAGR